MKSKLFSFLVLIYCTNSNGNKVVGRVKASTNYLNKIQDLEVDDPDMKAYGTTKFSQPARSIFPQIPWNTTQVPLSTTTSPPPTTTYPPSQTDDFLENISMQDFLSSDIDSSEKIEKKIINAVTQYSSNCRTIRKIDLSLNGFSFPTDSLTVNLDVENNAVFHNIRVFELPQNYYYKKLSHSTSIECDSLRMAKIEVKLPQNIAISADLKIIKTVTSSKGFQPIFDVVDRGSIRFTMMFNTLSRQFSIQPNSTNDEDDIIASKILYTNSEVLLNITTKFQMAVYNNLKIWFVQAESPIRQYLIEKLDTELLSNGISIADSCSKFITPEKTSKKVNLPFLNSNFNNLYVIPNAKLETWKGVSLSAGPIIIDGLSSFDSTKLIVLDRDTSTQGDENRGEWEDGIHFRTIPSSDDLEISATTVRIKTNGLKGKLNWSYNSRQRSFTFTLEYIQFELENRRSIQYTKNEDEIEFHSRYGGYNRFSPGEIYIKSTENKTNVNVYLGDIQIKSSKYSVCENENEFVNFVLSEYLKTVIADALKISLSKKLLNESIFVNCI